MLSFSRLRPRQAGRLSLRKRAAKPLIARRAFLSLTFIQATLHACIPACDSTFPKFNRITVYFCKFSLSRRTFPRMKNARPCDFGSQFIRGQLDLFSLRSRDCAFSAQFQRKFSANQTFSVKVSVNFHFTLLYFVPRPTPSGCKMPSLHIWCRI